MRYGHDHHTWARWDIQVHPPYVHPAVYLDTHRTWTRPTHLVATCGTGIRCLLHASGTCRWYKYYQTAHPSFSPANSWVHERLSTRFESYFSGRFRNCLRANVHRGDVQLKSAVLPQGDVDGNNRMLKSSWFSPPPETGPESWFSKAYYSFPGLWCRSCHTLIQGQQMCRRRGSSRL